MKYSPGTIAKAIMAFVTAFGGAAATSAPHDPIGWAGCIGAGFVAFAAVFATPNRTDIPAPADAAITAIQATIEQAITAQADVQRVAEAVTSAVSASPVGPVVAAAGGVVEQVIRAAVR